MKTANNEAYILGSARIPFVKSQTAYNTFTRKDLMVGALNGLVTQYGLKGRLIDDTALGAVMNGVLDFNLARESILETELHPESPGYNVQRACGTGLETVWQIALKAHTGAIRYGIAGGIDTNSDLPIEVSRKVQRGLLDAYKARTFGEKAKALSQITFKSLMPRIPSVNEPRTLKSMGEHTELMVKEWHVGRQEQDEIALASHVNGAKAYAEGFYSDLVHPFGGLDRDGTLRGDTSMEKLAKLKPAFDFTGSGTLTAGNSSPLTDGAAAVLVGSQEGADILGLKPLAKLIDVQTAAVDFVHGAGLLMAPTKAVSALLERNHLTFADFDFIEIHEAFAGQVLCNMKAWESDEYCRTVLGRKGAIGSIDRKKLNTKGSSIALGHPFAATGARIVGTLAKLLAQGGQKRGLISICTAGGMGIAAIMESA
jgi:acetyl-CoA C-acetyltransferase